MNGLESNQTHINTNGCTVWYEKFGSGPNTLLLIPGPIGTGRTDYWEQLEGEDAFDMDQFTIIAVEAPGWGRSRPPMRQYNSEVYNKDAQCFQGVMQSLGFEKYSVIGWSDGAKVALLMATIYPESIQSLVLIGIPVNYTMNSTKYLLSTQDTQKWPKSRVECYLRGYETVDEIQKLWTRLAKYIQYYDQYFPQDIYKDKYAMIECPVLIVHGDKDPIVSKEQSIKLSRDIVGAKLYRFPNGEHDCHQKNPMVFKEQVLKHLFDSSDGESIKKEVYFNAL